MHRERAHVGRADTVTDAVTGAAAASAAGATTDNAVPAAEPGAAQARPESGRPESARPESARRESAKAPAILGDTNPARFSRAEFRLCHLLSTGLGMKAVQAELGISDSTFRTHLRNIHDKTGTRGEAALLQLLLNAPPAAQADTAQPPAVPRPEHETHPAPASPADSSRAQETPVDPVAG